MTKTNEELIEQYKRYLKLDGKAGNSIYNYGQDIKNVLNHIGNNDITRIMREDYEDYIEDMIDSGQAPATIIRRVRSIQGFYKWLELKDICFNVASRLPVPSKEKKEKLLMPEKKIEEVIEKCESLEYKTLVSLFYQSMLRISEALNLTIDDVDLNNRRIHIKYGKRNRWRYVNMSNKVYDFLRYYIDENNIRVGKLFDITPNKVRENLKLVFENCDLKWSEQEGYTTHSLRHAGITKIANSGKVNMKTLSVLTGTSVEILLNVYVHVTEETKQNAINIFNEE